MQGPPEKLQKHEELTDPPTPSKKLSTLEVTDLMYRVALFRREGPKLLHDIRSAETQEIMKWSRKVKVEVPDHHKAIIPELPDIPAIWNQKEIKERLARITLLSVLERKAKCPIARIIDQI